MKDCAWLKPDLVAQIEFTEWTPDGHLKHSKFVGLREDKGAQEVLPVGLKTRVKDSLQPYGHRYKTLTRISSKTHYTEAKKKLG
jgi:hypothetical protein